MITSIPHFLFIHRFNARNRMFVVASIMSFYGLFLYESLPAYLFNPVYAVYYYVFPLAASIFASIFLPKMLQKNVIQSQSQNSEMVVGDISTINSASLEQTSIQDSVLATENSSVDMNSIPSGLEIPTVYAAPLESNPVGEKITTDDTTIHEMIDKKIEPVGDEISKIKTDTNALKEDMNTLKTSIEDMFSKFENTMIDLKSLQAEISSPLNFIQKNTDLVHKKDSSESTIPVIEHAYISPKYIFKDDIVEPDMKVKNSQVVGVTHTHDELDPNLKDRDNFKQIFSGNLTLGKLMEIILLVGEIMQKLGNDSVNLLIQQCKLMGLKPEVEDTIHNIANMLNKSGMSSNDTLIMMYKFAQIVGITDKDADRLYIKILTEKTKNDSNTTKKPLKDGVN